jgi:hypothetical protein
MLAGAFTDAHHRGAGVGHDRLHVGEVEVDEAGLRDQVADALDALTQDVVGEHERFLQRRALLDDLQDALVRDRDERVDFRLELFHPVLGHLHALAPFERERFRHDGDGQRTRLARELCDHGRRTGAGAAAHAGGDEHEVRAVEDHREIFTRFFRRFATDVRVCARAEAARQIVADLHRVGRAAIAQRLHVGVDRVEIDALQSGVDHAVDRVAAAAAEADDFDRCRVIGDMSFCISHGARLLGKRE